MEELYFIFTRQLRNVSMQFFRYLHDKIDWSNRLIFILGARGSGKTTLLLQHILKEFGETPRGVLYASLDHIWFSANKLYDLGVDFVLQGGRYLFLDEVHKYKNWSQEVKNLYDAFPELHIVLTGSSILEIYRGKADLSRRAVYYSLQGLSFREFLSYENQLMMEAVSLEDILDNHMELCSEITKKVKIIPAFGDYLTYGYFPYYKENIRTYHQRLLQTVNTVLEVDLPAVENIDYYSIDKIKQLLYIIAQMVPFTPNISQLSEKVGVSRNSLLAYLRYLEKAQVIQTLKQNKGKLGKLTKPEKIYLNNPNYNAAFAGKQSPDKGNTRETFFCNQLSQVTEVSFTEKTDFKVDDSYYFEIGGRTKGREQIKGLENVYIAADDIELGFGNKIPLWLFGFLY